MCQTLPAYKGVIAWQDWQQSVAVARCGFAWRTETENNGIDISSSAWQADMSDGHNRESIAKFVPITVLVVEEHDGMRSALQDWLALEFPAFRIVTARAKRGASRRINCETPRLAIVDVGLSWTAEEEVMRQICAALPGSRCIMLTVHEDGEFCPCHIWPCRTSCLSRHDMRSQFIPLVTELLAEMDY